MVRREKIFGFMLLCGMLSSIVYVGHVLIGGMLSEDYNHIVQPISDLTSLDASNREILVVLTSMYGILAIIFSIALFLLWKKKGNKILNVGLVSLIVMEVVSFIGYLLFPLDTAGMGEQSIQNTMHIVVTIIVVLTTIGFTFMIGIAFVRIETTRRLGKFILISGIVITATGVMTGIVISNEIPIAGLIERINIFTLQLMIFVVSLISYRRHRKIVN